MPHALIYPMKRMNIIKTYKQYKNHTDSGKADYPIDDKGSGLGREIIYAPCHVKVAKMHGSQLGRRFIWLCSVKPVVFANGVTDYFTMMIENADLEDMKDLQVGDTIPRKAPICRNSQYENGCPFFRISVGTGTTLLGWTLNGNGVHVLQTNGETLKPEDAFFVDRRFTEVISDGGLQFMELIENARQQLRARLFVPEVGGAYKKGNYQLTGDAILPIVDAPSKAGKLKPFSELSPKIQKRIIGKVGTPVSGYLPGMKFVVLETEGNMGRTPSGWICLDRCVMI